MTSFFTFDISSDVISRFSHVRTYYEAKMDAEQRYGIKYLIRKRILGKKLSVKLKKYMGLHYYKNWRFTSVNVRFFFCTN